MNNTTVFRLFLVLPFALLSGLGTLKADIKNFDLSAKIYTKWLYRNDDSQGVLWLGNPFWTDDIAGNNGVASEFDLNITGRPSRWVTAGARLQSRFGGLWQDWWESGERKWEYQGAHNTSGDSLGMNRAGYIKLRGTWLRMNPNMPLVQWIHVGSSELGMFNAWSIGRIRYIDRDNAKGLFVQGALENDSLLRFHGAAIALPKLWVGPNWSTGIGDEMLDNPYYSQDWAWGLKLESDPLDWWGIRLVGTLTRDLEFDRYDPDARGSLTSGCLDAMGNSIPGCIMDNAVGTYPRYSNAVVTLENILDISPLWMELLVAWSGSYIGKDFVSNGVQANGGMFPVVYKDASDWAGRLRLIADDPLDVGLGIKMELFRIGQDWNSIFGARREDDVLLTDGFLEGGQLPTLNIANEFIDFDEPWFESCIGWQGLTLLPFWTDGSWEIKSEFTYLDYDTNAQGRNVDEIYPTFLYTEGYTDTALYDYANLGDRGRDPRSVFKRDQDRHSLIGALWLSYAFSGGQKLESKFKYIHDSDLRLQKLDGELFSDDDYLGRIFTARFQASSPLLTGLSGGLGYQFDRWDEQNRRGSLATGYGDYLTVKHRGFARLSYNFGGAAFSYLLEYIHKDQDRPEKLQLDNQLWRVWRSKAVVEVAW